MLNSEQIRSKLKDSNLKKVSRGSGVDYQVIVRFMRGNNILSGSLEKLSDYVELGINELSNNLK